MNHDGRSLQRESRRGSAPLPLPIDTRDRVVRGPIGGASPLLPPLHVGPDRPRGNGGADAGISPVHVGAGVPSRPQMDRVADRWEAFPALGRALGGVDEAAAEKGAEGEDPRRDHIMDAATTEEGEAGDPRAGEMMEAASAAVGESESVPVPSTWEVGADLASPPGIAASEDSSKGEGEVAISPASESAADGERMSPASIPAEHDDGWWSEARADALAEEDAAQAIVGPGPAAVAAVESSASEWRDEEPILGEAEPEDEIALSGQAGFAMDLERLDRIATGALPSMAEPARLLEVAERLERIARTLREHGTTAPLVAQGQDPLGALITGYVLGYFEGAHARAPDRSG